MHAITSTWFEFCLCNDWANDCTIYVGVLMRILRQALSFIARLVFWPFQAIRKLLTGGDETLIFEVLNATTAIFSGLFLEISPRSASLHLSLDTMFPHEIWVIGLIALGEAQGYLAVNGTHIRRAWCTAISCVVWLLVIEAVALGASGASGYHAFLLPLLVGCVIATLVLLERHGSTNQAH